MFQNIKVDIIYYKTNTDFEMEFNLCGCCRMRLLTDKAPDRKTLVHSLARAVSRSRVIIIAGNLFGDDSIINLAAAATGTKLAVADNKTYGIDSNIDINIISGSTPLVTPEGYFGGCIIEKGPQTLILLSDNKNVRKSVMKLLIHPYIEELCALDLKEKAASVTEGQNVLQEEKATEPETLKDEPIKEESPLQAEEDVPEIPQTPEAATESTEIKEAVEESEPDAIASELIFDTDDTEESIEEIIAEAENAELDASNFVFQDAADDVADENTAIEHEGEIYDFVTEEEEEESEYYEEEMDLVTEDDYEDIEMESSDSDIFATDDDEVESDLLYDNNTIDLKTFKRRNEEYYSEDETVEGLLAEEEEGYIRKGDFKGNFNISILIVALIVFITLIIVCYCLFFVPSQEGVSATAYIKEIYNTLFG